MTNKPMQLIQGDIISISAGNLTNKPMQLIQGDIISIKADHSERKGMRPLTDRHLVAEGEASGHNHVITATRDSEVLFEEANGVTYLRVLRGEALLSHVLGETATKADHEPITLPVGDWTLLRQREYSELGDRKVID